MKDCNTLKTCESCLWTHFDRLTGVRSCNLPEEHDPLCNQWDQMDEYGLDHEDSIDPNFGSVCYWHEHNADDPGKVSGELVTYEQLGLKL
jgi:hypothetical protein